MKHALTGNKVKKLSVIIACYNQQEHITQTVESVIKVVKKLPSCEVILWDDASQDSTFSIINEFAKRYPDLIQAKRSEQNLGIAACAAAMVNAAQGEYLMIFDHDDILLPFNINEALEFLDTNPDYSCSYGRKLQFQADKPRDDWSNMGRPYSDLLLLWQPPVNNNAMIMRKSCVIEAGNYQSPTPNSPAADIFMWLRLRLQGKFHFQDEIRLLHRIHSRQVTNQTAELDLQYKKDYQAMFEYMINRYPEIYNNFKKGSSIDLSTNDIFIALIILGGMIRQSSSDSEVSTYLFYAQQLAKNDNSVKLKIADFYIKHEEFDQALPLFTEVALESSSSLLQLIAIRGLLECFKAKNYSLDTLITLENSITTKVFTLSAQSETTITELLESNLNSIIFND